MKLLQRYCSDCDKVTDQEIVKIQESRIYSLKGYACRSCKTIIDEIPETIEEIQKRVDQEQKL